jgi:hypothetical protein
LQPVTYMFGHGCDRGEADSTKNNCTHKSRGHGYFPGETRKVSNTKQKLQTNPQGGGGAPISKGIQFATKGKLARIILQFLDNFAPVPELRRQGV